MKSASSDSRWIFARRRAMGSLQCVASSKGTVVVVDAHDVRVAYNAKARVGAEAMARFGAWARAMARARAGSGAMTRARADALHVACGVGAWPVAGSR